MSRSHVLLEQASICSLRVLRTSADHGFLFTSFYVTLFLSNFQLRCSLYLQ